MYSRRIDDRTLTLAPSGWTYQNIFVLYDRETGTLWYPGPGGLKGIQGPYVDRRLPELPSEDTTWNQWRQRHPRSLVVP